MGTERREGRKKRNELVEDQKKKQRAADASATKKVGLLQQIAKLQADFKATEALHASQQQAPMAPPR